MGPAALPAGRMTPTWRLDSREENVGCLRSDLSAAGSEGDLDIVVVLKHKEVKRRSKVEDESVYLPASPPPFLLF